jgi:hypothetical protein
MRADLLFEIETFMFWNRFFCGNRSLKGFLVFAEEQEEPTDPSVTDSLRSMITKADEYRELKEKNKRIQVKEFKVISQIKLGVDMQDNEISRLRKILNEAMNKAQ